MNSQTIENNVHKITRAFTEWIKLKNQTKDINTKNKELIDKLSEEIGIKSPIIRQLFGMKYKEIIKQDDSPFQVVELFRKLSNHQNMIRN